MLKNISITFASKLLIAVLNLLVVILLSRYLGPFGKGQASLVLTSVTLFLIACNVVGGATLVYLVPRFSMKSLLLISYCWTIFSCGIVFVFIHLLHLLPTAFELPVLILSILDSFFSINTTILLGKEKIKTVNTLYFMKAFLVACILFLFLTVFKTQTVNAYVYTLYVSFSLVFLLSSIFVLQIKVSDEANKNIREVLNYCLKLGGINQFGHILQFASLRLSYYLLNHFSKEGELGIYSNGVSLAEAVWLISNSVATVQYSKIANSDNTEKSVKLTVDLAKTSLLICLAAVIVMAALPTSFYTALFGPEFANVKQVIYTLIPGVFFYNTALIVGHYFSGIGKYQVEVWGNGAGLVVTLVLSLFALAQGYSSMWAGIISSVSYIVTTAVIVFYFRKYHQIQPSALLPSLSDLKKLIRF